jgi:internalin A
MNRIVLQILALSLMMGCASWGWAAEQTKTAEQLKPVQSIDQSKTSAIIKELSGTVPDKPVSMLKLQDKSEQQAKAIAEIEKMGGHCSMDDNSPNKPVIAVALVGNKVTDAELEHLKELNALTSLTLSRTNITDAGLEHLKGLTQLEYLILDGTHITDAGLENIKALKQLRTLDLTATQVTDAGLGKLIGLTKLSTLYLLDTKVTDEGVLKLQQALPPMCSVYFDSVENKNMMLEQAEFFAKMKEQEGTIAEIVKLGGSVVKCSNTVIGPVIYFIRVDAKGTQFTDAGLLKLKDLPNVQELLLGGAQVTDAGMIHLKGLTQLQALELNGTQVTSAGLRHLNGLTRLQTLKLSNTKVTDAGLAHLKGFNQLRHLNLCETQITDAGLEHLKGLTEFSTLDLSGNFITDAGLDNLKGLTNLTDLNLSGTKVTDEGVKKLQQALQKCNIRHF